jgi:flagellar export protein FliJ
MAFRFEKVLRVRKYKEDLAKEKVAEWERTVGFEEALLFRIEEMIADSLDKIERFQKDAFSIEDMKIRHSFILQLEREREKQRKRVKKVKESLEEARESLVETSCERRVIERLKEKYEIERRAEEEKIDQGIMDEIGISLFNRKANILSFKGVK